jgi:hypothetical protein
MIDDDPKPRGAHWRRYRRLLAMMFGLAVVTVGIALVVLRGEGVVLRPNFVIALALGIGVSLLLAGALMGLVFVSANSGHDDSVERPRDSPRRGPGPWP